MFSRFLSFATSLVGGLVIICWPSSFFVVTLSLPRKMGEFFFRSNLLDFCLLKCK